MPLESRVLTPEAPMIVSHLTLQSACCRLLRPGHRSWIYYNTMKRIIYKNGLAIIEYSPLFDQPTSNASGLGRGWLVPVSV